MSILLPGQFVSAAEPIRERIEWADIWVTDADKNDLPRVLLVGDSTTRGYFADVEKRLAGKAYCARLMTSKCVSDPSFADEVQLLLKHYKFAVIHFNNGLHGWGYTEPQDRDGLVKTLDTVRKQAAGDRRAKRTHVEGLIGVENGPTVVVSGSFESFRFRALDAKDVDCGRLRTDQACSS